MISRSVVRCCALLVAGLCALQVLPWPWPALAVPAASPYVAVCAGLARRAVDAAALIALPVLIIAMVRRRWFCHRLCPTGLLVETVGRLRRRPRAIGTERPRVGPWLVLLALAGAVVGYPVLLWLDPLAMFSSCVGLFGRPTTIAGLASGACLPIVLLLSVFWPQGWCRHLCPLGATQDLLALPRPRSQTDRDAPSKPALVRRSVLAVGLGLLWAGVVRQAFRKRSSAVLRPPGARPDPEFAALCARCGNCARACPAHVVHADLGQGGPAAFLAPSLLFEDAYCLEGCARCTQVCPTGAIRRLSVEDKKRTPIGLAEVSMSLCLLADDRECSACQSQCPYDAIRIVFNPQTYLSEPRVDASKCPGCGACQLACPTTAKAIVVRPSPRVVGRPA